LNRPAYLYVLWIDTDGKALPVYPGRPGHWEDRPAQERPVAKPRRPEALDAFYKISQGNAGNGDACAARLGDAAANGCGGLRVELGDAVLLTQQRVRTWLMERHFTYGLAVSFANRGKRRQSGNGE
jgi:hypothetical protein